VAKGEKMGKEQKERKRLFDSEQRLFKAAVGLNALYVANKWGNNHSSEAIEEGLRALADMPENEFRNLVEMARKSGDNKTK
jgi:hypothetical protein